MSEDGGFESFTDVREVRERLAAAGLAVDSAVVDGSTGTGSITLVDPDGNPILIDQFF